MARLPTKNTWVPRAFGPICPLVLKGHREGGPLESDESPTWLVADPSSPAANGLEHTRARAWEIEGQSELGIQSLDFV